MKMLLLTTLTALLAGCPENKAAPSPATTVSSAVPSTVDGAASTCDVTVIGGERIGDERLAGAPSKSVTIEKEPMGKTYCVLNVTLKKGDKLADVEARLDKACDWSKQVNDGATVLQCKASGVGLIFGGPPLLFSAIQIFPKGSVPPK